MKHLRPALLLALFFFIFTGLVFPLAVTGFANAVFPRQATGSLVSDAKGRPVGSELVGQNFTGPRYFQSRPSAAGSGYDASSSSGSNLGPTNQKFLDQVRERATAYRTENGLTPDTDLPADAVTTSGSGLDPHISVANALLQLPRVARERKLSESQVKELINQATTEPLFGFFGDRGVNVLKLNLALDRLAPVPAR